MGRKTQQQRLQDIVRTNIAPTMKRAGFLKKSNSFVRDRLEKVDFLNIISSRYNTGDNVGFTLEMYVMLPGKRPVYDEELAFERVGTLRTGKDVWYELTPKVDQPQLGREIEKDIAEYVLPYFDNYGVK